MYSDLYLAHCASPDVLVLPSRPLFSTTSIADLAWAQPLIHHIGNRQMAVLRELLIICQQKEELQLTDLNIKSLRMMLTRFDLD